MKDYNFWTAIYAAILSTIVFLWKLYEFYDDRRGKLLVEVKRVDKILYLNTKCGDIAPFIVVKITNQGKSKRYIEEPTFITNLPDKKYFNILNFDKKIKYPIPLESGEMHEYSIPFTTIKDELGTYKINKIKSTITDTHKKRYNSNWLDLN